MSSDEILVDPDELERLATSIRAVRFDLTQAKALFTDPYGGLQDRRVSDALDHFNASWNQKRGYLVHQLGSAADALDGAADDFRTGDCKLANALRDTEPHKRG